MKFSIITPCFNSEHLIEETILSVINQSALLNKLIYVEYILIDGQSTDKTLKIINSFKSKGNLEIIILSEKDNGMYEALSKGFKLSTGNIQSYINAGDFYNIHAFQIVKNVFLKNLEINWLIGDKYIYNNRSEIIKHSTPYKYRNNLIQAGVYGRYLPFIQQESIFWRSKLNKYINHNKLKSLKLAGDYYLWKTFSKYSELKIIKSHLGGFKIHEGQLSSKKNIYGMNYKQEMLTFTKKISIKDLFYIFIDLIPWFILKYSSVIFGVLGGHHELDITDNTKRKESTVYCWACDISKISGEGRLLQIFISANLADYKYIFIKTINKSPVLYQNLNQLNFKKKLRINFLESYISPFLGVVYLWYKHILGYKTCYINFLPLWNSLLFLLLPPKTKLGPITGSIYNGNVYNIETFLRKYIQKILYRLSNFILNIFRQQNLSFSTDILKKFISKKNLKRSKFNFVFNQITINKYNKFKNIDLIIYNRNYFNKSNKFIKEIINHFKKKFRVYYFGDKIRYVNNSYLGIIDNNELNNYLARSKFCIISSENFYSFFCFDSIKNNVNIFYDEKLMVKINWIKNSKKIIPLNYENIAESKSKIEKTINSFYNYDFPYYLKN